MGSPRFLKIFLQSFCSRGILLSPVKKQESGTPQMPTPHMEVDWQNGVVYVFFEKEYIQSGRNPLFSRISAAFTLICRLNLQADTKR